MSTINDAVRSEISGSRLPPLPHVLVELLDVCQDQAANFQDIANVISHDAALASQLLSIANSSFYGRSSSVNSIEQALLLLGTDAVKTMVITASVQQFCSDFKSQQQSYSKQFWQQSLYCALIAKALARLTNYPSPEEAYLIGLIHNIGELLMSVNHADQFVELVNTSEGYRTQVQAEQNLYHTNHCELGGVMLRQWGLNDFSADAVAFHHSSLGDVVDAHHLTKVIFLAARLAEPGGAEDAFSIESGERLFGLNGALVQQVVAKISSEVESIAQALSIDIEGALHQDLADMRDRIGLQLQRRLVAQEVKSYFGDQLEAKISLPRSVMEAASLLFGARGSLFLNYEEPTDKLILELGEQFASQGAEGLISVRVSDSESRVAESAVSRNVVHFPCSPELPIVDQQLARLCGGQVLVYAPVVYLDRLVGVLVMGDTDRMGPDAVRLSMIEDFAAHVGRVMVLELESEQSQSPEMAEYRHKVRAVVHEVNNPLAIIRNYLEALSAASGQEGDDRKYSILREEIDRASQILTRLQDIEVGCGADQEQPGVNQEIRSLVNVFEHSLFNSNQVICDLELDDQLDNLSLPRNPLRQVITNLVKNAAEAMPNGGNLKISTGISIGSSKGRSVEIDIEDNGPGIPVDVQSNLFMPGNSTKGVGHSGLGLSITRNLIAEMDGSISCQSNSRGTHFRVLIPIPKKRSK